MTDALVEAVALSIGAARIQIRGEGPTVLVIDTVYARAALAAIEAEGWVIVPAQLTPAMWKAAEANDGTVVSQGTWTAMLSARPEQDDVG